MSNDVIFLTFILIMQLIGLATIWYQEIKPKLDDLYIKCKKLEEKVTDLEYDLEAHKRDNNKFLAKAAANLTVENLNKIMQQHIEGCFFSDKREAKNDIILKEDDAKYFNVLMTIMKNSLPIKQIMMGWHSSWYLITEVDKNNQVFYTRKSMLNFSDIETFVILINNQEMSFKDFADSRPTSLNDILNSTTKE